MISFLSLFDIEAVYTLSELNGAVIDAWFGARLSCRYEIQQKIKENTSELIQQQAADAAVVEFLRGLKDRDHVLDKYLSLWDNTLGEYEKLNSSTLKDSLPKLSTTHCAGAANAVLQHAEKALMVLAAAGVVAHAPLIALPYLGSGLCVSAIRGGAAVEIDQRKHTAGGAVNVIKDASSKLYGYVKQGSDFRIEAIMKNDFEGTMKGNKLALDWLLFAPYERLLDPLKHSPKHRIIKALLQKLNYKVVIATSKNHPSCRAKLMRIQANILRACANALDRDNNKAHEMYINMATNLDRQAKACDLSSRITAQLQKVTSGTILEGLLQVFLMSAVVVGLVFLAAFVAVLPLWLPVTLGIMLFVRMGYPNIFDVFVFSESNTTLLNSMHGLIEDNNTAEHAFVDQVFNGVNANPVPARLDIIQRLNNWLRGNTPQQAPPALYPGVGPTDIESEDGFVEDLKDYNDRPALYERYDQNVYQGKWFPWTEACLAHWRAQDSWFKVVHDGPVGHGTPVAEAVPVGEAVPVARPAVT